MLSRFTQYSSADVFCCLLCTAPNITKVRTYFSFFVLFPWSNHQQGHLTFLRENENSSPLSPVGSSSITSPVGY